ncbi:MAG TPA: hypothetical protein VFK89_05730 [Actinomycetota bacterium]|nr:hypothetical protein [Actinomycetota bacterium]
MSTPRATARRLPASGWIGVGLGLAWCCFLAGLGLFSDGRLDAQWPYALAFVLVAASPAVLVAASRNRAGLIVATVSTLPIAMLSLAGATLPLLIPALFYIAAAIELGRGSREVGANDLG